MQVAGCLWRLLPSVHGGGTCEYRKIIFVETDFLAQVIGP